LFNGSFTKQSLIDRTIQHKLPSPSRSTLMTRRRLAVRATETDANEAVKSKAPDKAPAGGSSFNQLLGIKGAAQETDDLAMLMMPDWILIVLTVVVQNKWKIRLQLAKPVTWPPLVWGVVCGAVASGNFHWTLEDVAKSIVCMLMSGPCLTGYTQTLNDWYDREIDAVNEPYRPIPSGAISESEVPYLLIYVVNILHQLITQIWVLLLGGLGLAGLLDVWAGLNFPTIFYLAMGGGGSLLSYVYSAPPLKLKQNGWIGNFALGASYNSLPWYNLLLDIPQLKVDDRWAGQALFGTLTPDRIVLILLYSIAGLSFEPKYLVSTYFAEAITKLYMLFQFHLGIAIVNDFKSIEGDRALGLQVILLPLDMPRPSLVSFLQSLVKYVAFGIDTAKWICVGAIDVTQLSAAGYLLGAGKSYYALALLGLIIPQVVFQASCVSFQYFLKHPIKYDVKYQASA
ncbi:UbiA prenyltransferase family, partial [Dillenia turbinata]